MPGCRHSSDIVLAAYAAPVLLCRGVCRDLRVAVREYCAIQVAAMAGGAEGLASALSPLTEKLKGIGRAPFARLETQPLLRIKNLCAALLAQLRSVISF